jgi:phosphoribosylaminoimidazolecarboxamide formyltransferase/IMP cyclohydrolase
MKKCALLSVSEREGLVELGSALIDSGYEILATSGTGRFLKEGGVPFTSVESYTGLAELLGGRVKTLHPKIHGGILAKRDDVQHCEQLEAAAIEFIDVVVVNLYPFQKYVNSERAKSMDEMVELIDIGGPTMIRAAAKNHKHVLPVIDPKDYQSIISHLREGLEFDSVFRRRLAAKVFSYMAEYDASIGAYLAMTEATEDENFPEAVSVTLQRSASLRYGENPHQAGSVYTATSKNLNFFGGADWKQLQGKELSYNNMLDLDAGLRLMADLSSDTPTVAILKHLNPCGLATGESCAVAIQRAKQCDPRSHFGGILVLSCAVDADAAEEIKGDFAEIVIAPSYDPEARAILETRKNLRLIEVKKSTMGGFEMRTVAGSILLQEPDVRRSVVTMEGLMSKRVPSQEELSDLELAWRIVGHVKSNAIVLVRDGLLIGVGAGQMSRIDSIELAFKKAKMHGHIVSGAVAASDAFFPFADSIEAFANEGVCAVIAPSGARRDEEICTVASEKNVSLFFAPDRHFRH